MNDPENTLPEIPSQPDAGAFPNHNPGEVDESGLPIDPSVTQASDLDETKAIPSLPNAISSGLEDTQISDDVNPTIPQNIPALNGKWNHDLPDSVAEYDLDATHVTPAAFSYQNPPPSSPRPKIDVNYNLAKPSRFNQQNKPKAPTKRRSLGGCLLRIFIALLFMVIVAGLGAGSFLVFQYFRISANLPSVDELLQHASQFETTIIYDRDENPIYELLDPNAGRRTYVSLDEVSPYVIVTTLATEDHGFFTNPGYDLLAMFRALWQNYTSGEIVSGASTITQQLARNLLLGPEERYIQTAERKAREIILASEITRQYGKDQILELYLNENNYANLAYGIEAAAELYFHCHASELTLGQAAFLAGIPQAPAVYDIFTNPEETLRRTEQVMRLIFELANESGGCIDIGPGREPVCISATDVQAAADEIAQTNFTLPTNDMVYPHWVNYIRSLLEEQFGSDSIYRTGFRVYTTLDPSLQQSAEQIVQQQVQSLAELNVQDGALVAIQPSTGEILAMVGSADFNNVAISGQINMALVPRQPGSSIKPLTYTAAFERGWTPATLIWDVPIEFPPSSDPNDPNPPYIPNNYDGRFHGPVTVRTALANSYNIPAVRTLQFVGIYDDPNTPAPDGFLNFARRVGITTLNQDYYGLSLTLGGGEVTLLEMTGVFATYANNGLRIPPIAILRIEDYQGNIVYQYSPPSGEQVIRPEHAYLISSILSDNQARAPMFGTNSVLNLPFTAAVKTGTTNDFRDNWTLGYTPDLAVGVWVGNADYTPMQNTTGVTGAAPIWSQFMQVAIQELTGGNPSPFIRPAGVVDQVICTISGTQPSELCPAQRTEIFAFDQPPLASNFDLWQEIQFDTWTGLRASSACQDYIDEVVGVNTTDTWAQAWLQNTSDGQNWATNNGFNLPLYFPPERECEAGDSRPEIVFVGLNDGDTITSNPLDLYAIVNATSHFSSFRLDYRTETSGWQNLMHSTTAYSSPENIYSWNLSGVPSGPVWLRIIMEGDDQRYARRQIRLVLRVPTPTPTETAIPTSIGTSTPTETATPAP